MKILFVSRAYPPVIGGIEKQNQEIATALQSLCDMDVIVNRKGKAMLPLFLPWATLRALLSLHRYDAVLLGDGVLGVVGALLKLFTKKPVFCIVHGLDLTYQNRLYQRFWVGSFLPKLDGLIAVGNETIRQGRAYGIAANKFSFVPNGVSLADEHPEYSRKDLETSIGRALPGPVLLTLGRLIKRKGVAWFVEHVLHNLDKDITYLIAGSGPERETIQAAIDKHRLQDQALLLGEVTNRQKELLLACTDLFIQPNIKVAGDMEGFGLVVLEAAAAGRVVIAANLEGLRDAVSDGNNGFLVTAGDAEAYRSRITSLLGNPEEMARAGVHARAYVSTHFSWTMIANKYLDLLTARVDLH